jgi:hypothetical protein
LPAIRLLNAALDGLSPAFAAIYTGTGRPSIPPEKLLRALLLQALFMIRFEWQLMQSYRPTSVFQRPHGSDPILAATSLTQGRRRGQ